MTDDNRYMFVLAGAAGAGKSTLANKIKDSAPGCGIRPIADICEADDYWYLIGKGEYAFDFTKLHLAHKWCQNKVAELAESGKNIIVSNTNIKSKDRRIYFDIAKDFGYKVVFIHLTTQFKSIHGVPDESVKRMRDNYQSPTAYELSSIVKKDDMTPELGNLLAKVGIVDYGY